MESYQQRIEENWQSVVDDVARAAKNAGRVAAEITIVGVTKYVGWELTKALYDAGCVHLGENRPQVLWEKADAQQQQAISWHLIGHLQRNKTRRTVPLLHRVHSIDSLRLAKAVNEAVATDESPQTCKCLIEVNVSGDEAKHGFQPGEVETVLEDLASLQHLAFDGLMCMAAHGSEPEEARRDFAALRELRDRIRLSSPENVQLCELSMGMSSDFPQAIEEGATIIRVGSRLYEGVPR